MAAEVPQQREFLDSGLAFFSDFDSGNLSQVVKSGQFTYELSVSPDTIARGLTHNCVWFHFGVRGLSKGQSIRIVMVNLRPARALTSPGYRPVFRETAQEWQRLPSDCRRECPSGGTFKLSWCFRASESVQEVFFAFTAPYKYSDIVELVNSIGRLQLCEVYCHSAVLTLSAEERPVHLLTITHKDNVAGCREDPVPRLFPGDERPLKALKRWSSSQAGCTQGKRPVLSSSSPS